MEDEDLMEASDMPDLHPIGSEADFDSQLRHLAKLSDLVEDATATLKKLNAERFALSAHLARYMVTANCGGKTLDGIKFTQKKKVRSKVVDPDALRQWIAEDMAERVNLLMAVHNSKLTSYCSEGENEIPPGVDPRYVQYYVHLK